MLHKRSTIKHSQKLHKEDIAHKRTCPFCDTSQIAEIIEENGTMRVIRQRVAYDQFEGVPVRDHLMIIPKKYRRDFTELTDKEKIDFMTLAGKYESGSYSVYSRGAEAKTRSQPHLHAHLMKLEGYRVRRMLFIDRPYILWMGKQRQRQTH